MSGHRILSVRQQAHVPKDETGGRGRPGKQRIQCWTPPGGAMEDTRRQAGFRKLPAPVLPGSGAKGLSQPHRCIRPACKAPLFRRESLDHKRRAGRKPGRPGADGPRRLLLARAAVWHNATSACPRRRRGLSPQPRRPSRGVSRERFSLNFHLRRSRQNRATCASTSAPGAGRRGRGPGRNCISAVAPVRHDWATEAQPR